MEDIGESGGHSQDNLLPVLSEYDVRNCGCGAMVEAQTNLLRQRLMNSVAYELSEYEQFMDSFLSNKQVHLSYNQLNCSIVYFQTSHYNNGCEFNPNEIEHILSEMMRISVNVLISVINS